MISKEQVEELGWINKPDVFARSRNLPLTHHWFTKDGFGLILYLNDGTVSITDDRVHYQIPNYVFNYKLKEIGQLKNIMNILEI